MNNALQNHDCPPLMSDGRIATDYRPHCDVDLLIQRQNKLTNSTEARAFLQKNAVNLMKMNRRHFQEQFFCPSADGIFHVDPNQHDRYWAQYKKNLERTTQPLLL